MATERLNAVLVFSDSCFFLGKGIGKIGEVLGEIAFNTGMTGYQETLTDPSYAGQILTFSYPHIGNTGINLLDDESVQPLVYGLVLRNFLGIESNYRQEISFEDWLIKKGLTGICGVDTRAIIRHIKRVGHVNTMIIYKKIGETLPLIQSKSTHCADQYVVYPRLIEKIKSAPSLMSASLVLQATGTTLPEDRLGAYDIEQGQYEVCQPVQYRIVLIDFGLKYHIVRCLNHVGFEVIVLQADVSFEHIMRHQPQGIFLSNGPADPLQAAQYALETIQKILDVGLPIFGICMGHQLLALACGLQTQKMTQGHRGNNHPVKCLKTGRVEITAQNHGFCVVHQTMPACVEVTHVSLFDGTIEGIKRTDKPAFSVQFHPESSSGPHDSLYLFEDFFRLVDEYVVNQNSQLN